MKAFLSHTSSDKDLVRLVQKKLTQDNAYKKNQASERILLANHFSGEMSIAKKEFREKYGADTLIEQDFLPDS